MFAWQWCVAHLLRWTTLIWWAADGHIMTSTLWFGISVMMDSFRDTYRPSAADPMGPGRDPRSSVPSVRVLKIKVLNVNTVVYLSFHVCCLSPDSTTISPLPPATPQISPWAPETQETRVWSQGAGLNRRGGVRREGRPLWALWHQFLRLRKRNRDGQKQSLL